MAEKGDVKVTVSPTENTLGFMNTDVHKYFTLSDGKDKFVFIYTSISFEFVLQKKTQGRI